MNDERKLITYLQDIFVYVDMKKDIEHMIIETAKKIYELFYNDDDDDDDDDDPDSGGFVSQVSKFLGCGEDTAAELVNCMATLSEEASGKYLPMSYKIIEDYSDIIWYTIFNLRKREWENEKD